MSKEKIDRTHSSVRSIRGSLLLNASAVTLSSASALGASLLLYREASASAYADISVLFFSITFWAGVIRLGGDRLIGPESVKALENGNAVAAKIIRLTLLAAALGTFALTFTPLNWVLNRPLRTSLSPNEQFLVASWLFSESVRFVTAEYLRAKFHLIAAIITSNGLRMPLYMIGIVILSLSAEPTRYQLIALNAAVSAVPMFIGFAMLFRMGRGVSVACGKREYRYRIDVSAHLHLAAASAASGVLIGADLWFVSSYFGTDEASSYALVLTATSAFSVLSSMLATAMNPYILQWAGSKQNQLITATCSRVSRIGALSSFAIALIFVAVLPWVASALGKPLVASAQWVALVLASAHSIAILCGPSGHAFAAFGDYKLVGRLITIISVLTLPLLFISAYSRLSPVLVAATAAISIVTLHLVSNLLLLRRHSVTTHGLQFIHR